jgi:hypothetical protein
VWTITVCDGCGERIVGVQGHAGRCDPASESEVTVVRASDHAGAVEPLVEAYDHLIHERRDYAIVCIEHALVALGVDPTTARGQ